MWTNARQCQVSAPAATASTRSAPTSANVPPATVRARRATSAKVSPRATSNQEEDAVNAQQTALGFFFFFFHLAIICLEYSASLDYAKKVEVQNHFIGTTARQSCVLFTITAGYLGSVDKSLRGV